MTAARKQAPTFPPMMVVSGEELERMIRQAVAQAVRDAKPEGPAYLDLQEAAELVGVTTTTLRTYVRTQGLPVHRIGARTLRFVRTEIAQWMIERGAAPGGHAEKARGKVHGLVPKNR